MNFLKIPLLVIFAVGAVAQQPDRIEKDVRYLASDTLEGRRTGTEGATEAASYIAKEFSRLKLKSLAPNYLQKFPYVAGVTLGKTNAFIFGTDKLEPGVDWQPLGFSSSTKVAGGLVFVGYGITASELNHNDYASVDATGKIAVALQGTPDGANPHGRFARFEGVRWKAVAARNAGAKALIVIAREANLKDDRLSQLSYDNSAGDAGLPVVVVSQAKIGGRSVFEDLEKRAKSGLTEGQANLMASLTVDLVRQDSPAYNVIGVLDGSDRTLKNEVIVIGAHYDHLGRGGEGSLAPKSGEIHHGADDNASGVAGVLELARLLSSQRPKPRRTIVFMAFSGEEEGLLGSNYYVNHPLVPIGNTVAMINMDMIGRMKDRKLIIGGVGTAKEWREMLGAQNAAQSMTASATSGSGPTSGMQVPSLIAVAPGKSFDLTLQED